MLSEEFLEAGWKTGEKSVQQAASQPAHRAAKPPQSRRYSGGLQTPILTAKEAREIQRSPRRRSRWKDCVAPSARTRHSAGSVEASLRCSGLLLSSLICHVWPPLGDSKSTKRPASPPCPRSITTPPLVLEPKRNSRIEPKRFSAFSLRMLCWRHVLPPSLVSSTNGSCGKGKSSCPPAHPAWVSPNWRWSRPAPRIRGWISRHVRPASSLPSRTE